MPIDKSGKPLNQELVDRIQLPMLDPDLGRALVTSESIVTFAKASHIDKTPWSATCDVVLIWFMGGRAWTNQQGECLINLNKLLCLKHDEESNGYGSNITNEPWFVATPISLKGPVIITTSYEMQPSALPPSHVPIDRPQNFLGIYEVTVKINSWKLDGTSAPHVNFAWHCFVEGVRSSVVYG